VGTKVKRLMLFVLLLGFTSELPAAQLNRFRLSPTNHRALRGTCIALILVSGFFTGRYLVNRPTSLPLPLMELKKEIDSHIWGRVLERHVDKPTPLVDQLTNQLKRTSNEVSFLRRMKEKNKSIENDPEARALASTLFDHLAGPPFRIEGVDKIPQGALSPIVLTPLVLACSQCKELYETTKSDRSEFSVVLFEKFPFSLEEMRRKFKTGTESAIFNIIDLFHGLRSKAEDQNLDRLIKNTDSEPLRETLGSLLTTFREIRRVKDFLILNLGDIIQEPRVSQETKSFAAALKDIIEKPTLEAHDRDAFLRLVEGDFDSFSVVLLGLEADLVRMTQRTLFDSELDDSFDATLKSLSFLPNSINETKYHVHFVQGVEQYDRARNIARAWTEVAAKNIPTVVLSTMNQAHRIARLLDESFRLSGRDDVQIIIDPIPFEHIEHAARDIGESARIKEASKPFFPVGRRKK
jgi:hypothetical protein